MKYIRLYTGSDNESHYEDCELPFENIPPYSTTETQKAKGIRFLDLESVHGFHNAPARQYVVFLNNDVEFENRQGAKRTVKAGEVVLAEDTTGGGHITRSLNGKRTLAVFVTLE